MNEKALDTNTLLHDLEEDLIQIVGLVKALQHIQPDHNTSNCLVKALEEKTASLQKHFYHLWNTLTH